MIYNIKNKILQPVIQICITGNDSVETQGLMEELTTRFGKKIHATIFATESGCINHINKTTDIVFFVSLPPVVNNDYTDEINIRRTVRLKSALTDVFVLYDEIQKTEAIHFLYDLTHLNSFFGACRLKWKYWIITPLNFVLRLFKRQLIVDKYILDKAPHQFDSR